MDQKKLIRQLRWLIVFHALIVVISLGFLMNIIIEDRLHKIENSAFWSERHLDWIWQEDWDEYIRRGVDLMKQEMENLIKDVRNKEN